MPIGLVQIPGVDAAMQSAHKLRAMSWKGRSAVQAKLEEWRETEPADYKKIMAAIAYVGTTNRPYYNKNHVEKDETREHVPYPGAPQSCPIYEVRAHKGSARAFFYHAAGTEVVVFVHTFWKTKSSKSEQARKFAEARSIRDQVFAGVQTAIAALRRKGEL